MWKQTRSEARPRAAQEHIGATLEPPRAAQERPRAPQERPRGAQKRPKAAQEGPKSGQERPKSGPKAPNDRQREQNMCFFKCLESRLEALYIYISWYMYVYMYVLNKAKRTDRYKNVFR